MVKFIGTVEKVYKKALENWEKDGERGFARINGRMHDYGYLGPLEERYSVEITNDTITLAHWGTITLQVDFNGYVSYCYGESNSDRDSINTILYILDSPFKTRYRPVNGGFELYKGNEVVTL